MGRDEFQVTINHLVSVVNKTSLEVHSFGFMDIRAPWENVGIRGRRYVFDAFIVVDDAFVHGKFNGIIRRDGGDGAIRRSGRTWSFRSW